MPKSKSVHRQSTASARAAGKSPVKKASKATVPLIDAKVPLATLDISTLDAAERAELLEKLRNATSPVAMFELLGIAIDRGSILHSMDKLPHSDHTGLSSTDRGAVKLVRDTMRLLMMSTHARQRRASSRESGSVALNLYIAEDARDKLQKLKEPMESSTASEVVEKLIYKEAKSRRIE